MNLAGWRSGERNKEMGGRGYDAGTCFMARDVCEKYQSIQLPTEYYTVYNTFLHSARVLRQWISKFVPRTTVTINNMYTYHYHHHTKHVLVPLSQYITCTPPTVTTQNMYSYHCHNTKHVHVQLSQYKTCTRATVTIQNMYTYTTRYYKY